MPASQVYPPQAFFPTAPVKAEKLTDEVKDV